MATPLSGRYCSVRWNENIINSLGTWEIVINVDSAEVGEFGSVWKKTLPMMQGWSGTVTGFFDTNTSAQHQLTALLKNSLQANKIQDIRFFPESSISVESGTTAMYFMPAYTSVGSDTEAGAYITNVRVSADKNGLVSGSYDIIGYGPIALFISTGTMFVFSSSSG